MGWLAWMAWLAWLAWLGWLGWLGCLGRLGWLGRLGRLGFGRLGRLGPSPRLYGHRGCLLPDPPPILLKHVTKTSIAVPALPVIKPRTPDPPGIHEIHTNPLH